MNISGKYLFDPKCWCIKHEMDLNRIQKSQIEENFEIEK